jgi:hypothetical protein
LKGKRPDYTVSTVVQTESGDRWRDIGVGFASDRRFAGQGATNASAATLSPQFRKRGKRLRRALQIRMLPPARRAKRIAALLHDVGHVPFGHTLEDEFAGILKRHDRLAGPRLYMMLFDPQSEFAHIFEQQAPWVGRGHQTAIG